MRAGGRRGYREAVCSPEPSPTVEEVVRFEGLAFGAIGGRRAVARWSDGSVSEAIRWHSERILFCEGDLIGKTREQIRSLHRSRDGDGRWS
jgi:hypothetical protein